MPEFDRAFKAVAPNAHRASEKIAFAIAPSVQHVVLTTVDAADDIGDAVAGCSRVIGDCAMQRHMNDEPVVIAQPKSCISKDIGGQYRMRKSVNRKELDSHPIATSDVMPLARALENKQHR